METFSRLHRSLNQDHVSWSVLVQELPRRRRVLGQVADGRPETLLQVRAVERLTTASIGKILLLIALARDFEAARLDPAQSWAPEPADEVADSGLLQHLTRQALPLADHATLVGAVSDNLSTNVLLRAVGLDRVAQVATDLGLHDVVLHDRVRDHRGPDDPPALSTANAAGLVALMIALEKGAAISPGVSRRVTDWLRLDVDLSMVADAFGLDPLAHVGAERGIALWHKTGTSTGVRADCGVVTGPRSTVAYAVIANWEADPAGLDPVRDDVLQVMLDLGDGIRAIIS